MPRRKSSKKYLNSDFTIHDCANAPKPVTRAKKSATAETPSPEPSWDQFDVNEFDIIEEINEDGTKNFVYKKKRNHSKTEQDQNDTSCNYPEIVWYLISRYIKPEDIGRFARINKDTYAITKRESFWRTFYKRYCQNSMRMPERLRIENSYKVYGLRQRVIRALYHTYKVFTVWIMQQAVHDSRPHLLVKRRCVNVWYCKGPTYWCIYFKFKPCPIERVVTVGFIEELGRIDANSEEEAQVLQVTCQSFYEVPPLMGLTLSSVSVVLAQGFRHHRLHLGFNAGPYVSKDIVPEHSVVFDTVVNILVYDWWHPRYPHFENRLPSTMTDEESLPVLKKDFFS